MLQMITHSFTKDIHMEMDFLKCTTANVERGKLVKKSKVTLDKANIIRQLEEIHP